MKKLVFLFLLISLLSYSQQAYYNDVNLTLTGTALRDELATKIISTHSNFLSYTPGVWEACKVTDLDPDDVTNSNVLLIYGYSNIDGNYVTDRTRSKTLNGGIAGTEWNREHSYPKSLGIPDLGTSGPGSDAHHLRSSDITMNGNRGSLKYASGNGNTGSSNGGWYPGDEWKGDAARMMLYMYLRYGTRCLPSNVAIGATNTVDANMIDLLLDWNAEDPVSTYEDNRNTYHENTTLNAYAQGNRNPFIDNPNLATQIWGGTVAEDRWNITPDTEAPSAPTNLTASNSTNTTIDLNWTASTDNIAVTSYEIYVDGLLNNSSATNLFTVTGLTQNTTYNFTVFAKDAAGNTSTVSNTETATTTNIIDIEAPTTITDVTASNTTSTTVDLSWTAATDNIGVAFYEVFKDGVFLASTTPNSYAVTGLTAETSYNFTVYAKDVAGNTSAVSNTVAVTTTAVASGATDLFISEYVEGSINSKAIEIANFTGNAIDLSIYSIKKQVNGAGSWVNELLLSGTLNTNNVYVIGNSAGASGVTSVSNLTVTGAPIDFNGNDPIGLFKNNILIDIVGNFNGGSLDFAKDVTLRRNNSITSPNTTYTIGEWTTYPQDTFDGLGTHNVTLNVKEYTANLFTIYPNPTQNKSATIAIKTNAIITIIQVYNVMGQLILTIQKPIITNNKIKINNIPTGLYIVKVSNNKAYSTKRLIVQ